MTDVAYNCPRYGIVDFGKGPVEICCTETGLHVTHKCQVTITKDMRSNSIRRDAKRGRSFFFTSDENGNVSLETAVFEALGAASVCWDDLKGFGQFQSDRAKTIGETLLAHIRAYKFDLENVESEFLIKELRKRGYDITVWSET